MNLQLNMTQVQYWKLLGCSLHNTNGFHSEFLKSYYIFHRSKIWACTKDTICTCKFQHEVFKNKCTTRKDLISCTLIIMSIILWLLRIHKFKRQHNTTLTAYWVLNFTPQIWLFLFPNVLRDTMVDSETFLYILNQYLFIGT